MKLSNMILNNLNESVKPIKESTYNNVYDYVKANGGDMDVPDNTIDGVVCVVTPDSLNSWYDKAVVSAYKRVPMLDNGCADWYKFVKRYYNSFFKDEFYGSPEDIIEDDTLNNMFAGGCSEEFYKRMEIALTGTSIDDEVEDMKESEKLDEKDNGITLDDIANKAYKLGYEVLDDTRDDEGLTILVYKSESTEADNFDDFDNKKLYSYLSSIPNVRYQIDNDDQSCLAIWLKESKKLDESFDVNKVAKRIARYKEPDEHVFHSWYEELSPDKAEEMARQASLENPEDVFYVQYDDIMNSSSDFRYVNGVQYNINDGGFHYVNGLPKFHTDEDWLAVSRKEKTWEEIDAMKESVSSDKSTEVSNFIKDSVDKLQNTDYTNCKYNLDDTFAIYVGWSDGYDANDINNDLEIHSKKNPSYAINAIVGVRNDADFSDLDYITIPYYESGDIYNCQYTVSPKEDYTYLADSLLKAYEDIKEKYQSGELLIESNVLNKKSLKESDDFNVIEETEDYKLIKVELLSDGNMSQECIEYIDNEGKNLGTVSYTIYENGEYHIYTIEVRDDQRRRGIATILMKALQKEVGDNDIYFDTLTPSGKALLDKIADYDVYEEGKLKANKYKGRIKNEDAAIDNDPDLDADQVQADVDYWTDIDEANTEDVTDMKPIGVYTISNNSAIYVYQIEYDIEDRVLAGDSSDETKAKWRDIIYGDGEAYFWYGDIKVPFNDVVRTNI